MPAPKSSEFRRRAVGLARIGRWKVRCSVAWAPYGVPLAELPNMPRCGRSGKSSRFQAPAVTRSAGSVGNRVASSTNKREHDRRRG
jgi:hypothetical protein